MANYYVKTDGNDSHNGFTIDTAWQHPSYAAQQAVAGDTVYIEGGNYDNEYVVIENSGIEGNPITFEAYNGIPTLNGDGSGTGITITEKSYINITGIHFASYEYGIPLSAGVHNITISDFEMSDINKNAIRHGTWHNDTLSSYVVIKNFKINNTGERGIYILGEATNFHIFNGTILNPGGSGVYCRDGVHHTTLERLTVLDAGWASLKFHCPTATPPPDYPCTNNVIRDNYVSRAYHCEIDIHECCDNILIENNVVAGGGEDCREGIYFHNWGGTGIIRDNIITGAYYPDGNYYRYLRATRAAGGPGDIESATWINNIIYGAQTFSIQTEPPVLSATVINTTLVDPTAGITLWTPGTIEATREISTTPGTGYAIFASVPKGARIYLDGSDAGKETPAVIPNLSPGTHNYTLKLNGYLDESGNYTVVTKESGWAVPVRVVMTVGEMVTGAMTGTVKDTSNNLIQGVRINAI